MKLTFESTGEVLSAGGTSVYHYPIASGVPQNVTLSDMRGVTYLDARISRNGVVAASAHMVIYEGMTFNLSAMALALPPLNVLGKNSFNLNITDVVTLVATQSGTQTSTVVKVVSLACENIGGMIGSKYGKNQYGGGVDSFSGLTVPEGGAASTLAFDGLLGTFVAFNGNTEWRGMCFSNIVGLNYYYGRIVWTVKVKATGEHPVSARLYTPDGKTVLASEKIMPGEMKRIERTIESKNLSGVRMYVFSDGPAASPNQCVISEFGIYPNCAPPQWTPARMVEDSPYVGYLTDYRDGWSRKPFDNAFAILQDTGATSMRLFFREQSKTYRKYPDGNTGVGTMFNGIKWSALVYEYSIYNTNGSLYGCMRWKDDDIRQLPSCRVQLRWLNTKGAYDFMLFDTYKVVPVMNKYNTGGNAVDYYDVTVQRDIDGINDDALLQLTKSSEVNAILPDDCNQWGTATVVGNNTYSKSAGSTTQIMTIKLKVTL